MGYHGGAAGGYGEFPAEGVFVDEEAVDGRADGRPAQSVSGAGAVDWQDDGGEFAAAGESGAGTDGEPRATGWEESRKEFERFLGKGLSVGGGYHQGSETTELEDVGAYHRSVDAGVGVGGDVLRSAIVNAVNYYTLAALSEDNEDPEERRKRIEAQENGEALGALLGLAAGVISEIVQEDNEPYEHKID